MQDNLGWGLEGWDDGEWSGGVLGLILAMSTISY